MIANIIAVTLIALWAAFVVRSVVKSKQKQKKTGVPSGCYSCKAYQNGTCKSHCEAKK